MHTREEFEKIRIEAAEKMAQDSELAKEAMNVLDRADRHKWFHQTTWFGEPILDLPQDMFAMQEIIFKTRPDYIIELGVAWGGSLLYFSTLMEALGGKGIIGIDIYMPEDLISRINSHGKLSDRITLIKASSVEKETMDQVKSIVGDSKKVMINADSNHTHEHVLEELKLYSPLVKEGQYLICGDTIIEYMPEENRRDRPWGKGNNPATACLEFLKESNRFQIDKQLENKLLFTASPGGYLKCVKD